MRIRLRRIGQHLAEVEEVGLAQVDDGVFGHHLAGLLAQDAAGEPGEGFVAGNFLGAGQQLLVRGTEAQFKAFVFFGA